MSWQIPFFKEIEDSLIHEGKLHRSGRYPWGSGENPYQHPYRFKSATEFYDYVTALRKAGLNDTEIARYLTDNDGEPMTSSQLKSYRSIAVNQRRIENRAHALEMLDRGYSLSDIGRNMGVNESTVRSWLKETTVDRATKTERVAAVLKDAVDSRGMIDVSAGTENLINMKVPGVTQSRLDTAIRYLQGQGYEYYNNIKVNQLMTGHDTTFRVLAPPGTTWKYVQTHLGDIELVEAYYDRERDEMRAFKPPRNVDSRRVMIRYAEDGGTDQDGIIEVRRGVPELDLGANHFAQVRIAVDGTHYLKGIALPADDLPPGIDIRFNTNKHLGTPKMDCLKSLKDDPDLPFGSVIKFQPTFFDPKTGREELSALNIVAEEGSWDRWGLTLSSQFLSKQKPALAKRQLAIVVDQQKEELKSIMALENPVIKQEQLNAFAEDCESKAVHIKGAALPRQTTKALIPVPSMRANECYTTEYPDGTMLALVRFPHASTSEIPVVTVNNRNRDAQKRLGNSLDGIGVSPKILPQLSGADCDGDNVVCLVNNNGEIKTTRAIKELLEFDPKEYFKKSSDMTPTGVGKYLGEDGLEHKKDGFKKGQEMGKASNLITDMNLAGVSAFDDEMIRAIKYSMVVIDAEKHNLDWKAARNVYGIDNLEHKYQAHYNKNGELIFGGGATLISMRKKEIEVPETKSWGRIDKETGKVIKQETGRKYDAYKTIGYIEDLDLSESDLRETVIGADGQEHNKYRVNKRGRVQKYQGTKGAKSKVPLLLAVDAHTIGQGTQMEKIYADHIESLKELATIARKESANLNTKRISTREAREMYAVERASILAKWDAAMKRKPYQRQAERLANTQLQQKLNENPSIEYDKEQLKKLKRVCEAEARMRVGLDIKDDKLTITPREWQAIQAGCISADKLRDLYKMGDPDEFRKLAMPKQGKSITPGTIAKIKARANMGYGISEIAAQLGVSESTIKKYIQE